MSVLMNIQTLAAGLTAYAVQVALLLGVGLLLPALFALRLPRLRLAYWQALLLGILLLPLLQPRAERAAFTAEIRVGAGWLDRLSGPDLASPTASLLPWLLLAVAAGAVLRLGWLLIGFAALRHYRRTAEPAALVPAVAEAQERVGVRARFLVSDRVSGPVTFGWRAATVLLPRGFLALPPAAQRAVACHELLHVRRRDWLWSLFEEGVRALLWFHPAVWMLLSRLALSREQVVDGEVVRLTGARRAYLEALRNIALQSLHTRPAAVPGLPFFHHRSHLRERVAQLSQEVTMSRPRIATLAATCATVLALTAFLGASSFPMLAAAEAGGKPMKVEGDVQRPVPLSTPAPVYPDAAKQAKVEGKVVLDCIIDEQGHVNQAQVAQSSGNKDLDEAARQTVSQWTFHPAALKGKPVTVSYTLTINFMLDEKDKKK